MTQEIAYVVSGPSGTYEHRTHSLSEAWEYYDGQIDDGEGWAVGVKYADGTVSFDAPVRRPARITLR